MGGQQRQKEIEMLEAQRPVVKLVLPVAQAVEMAKSDMEREERERRQLSTTCGHQYQRKKIKESVDWNTFRYKKMNNEQLNDVLLGYPVSVCCVDEIKIRKGRFVITNTDTSRGPGKHWVAFYFPKLGPYEFYRGLIFVA